MFEFVSITFRILLIILQTNEEEFLLLIRYLVFFDDGFAQYLPVKKLHHVYHTGEAMHVEINSVQLSFF